MLITVLLKFWSRDHQESCNKVESEIPDKRLVGLEPETCWFYHNALTHKATILDMQHFFFGQVQQLTKRRDITTSGIL